MYQSTFSKCCIVAAFLAILFCNNEPDGEQYGSISGKILHPDNDLLIRLETLDGTDTIARDPATQMFIFDKLNYGNYLLKIKAKGYMLFEKKIVLNKPQYICHDIVLSKSTWQLAYHDPSSSQHLDSLFCSINEPSVTDTGFMVCITFSNDMDSASVENAITIVPDTAGVQKLWSRHLSLYLFFPYWKLSTIDTLKVSIGSMAKNEPWGETLGSDFSFFYPIDTNYIRSTRLKNK